MLGNLGWEDKPKPSYLIAAVETLHPLFTGFPTQELA